MPKFKTGDTIEITTDNEFNGMKFTVVECPEEKRNSLCSDWAWVEHEGKILPVPDDGYKVLGQSDSVDESLRQQTDDNLAGVFT